MANHSICNINFPQARLSSAVTSFVSVPDDSFGEQPRSCNRVEDLPLSSAAYYQASSFLEVMDSDYAKSIDDALVATSKELNQLSAWLRLAEAKFYNRGDAEARIHYAYIRHQLPFVARLKRRLDQIAETERIEIGDMRRMPLPNGKRKAAFLEMNSMRRNIDIVGFKKMKIDCGMELDN